VREQISVSKRYCPHTGGPKVAIMFRLQSAQESREYTLDVPTAELIAEQVLATCREHRERFAEEWFGPPPEVTRNT